VTDATTDSTMADATTDVTMTDAKTNAVAMSINGTVI